MKHGHAYRALLLVFVSVAFLGYTANVFLLTPQQERAAQQHKAIAALTRAVEKLSTGHAQLVEDQLIMQRNLDGFAHGPTADISASRRDAQRFANKLEALERDLAALGQAQEKPARASESLSARLDAEALQGSNGPSPIGEELFQSDYGAPLEGQEELLSLAFDSAGVNENSAQVSCKSTICKVTYRTDESSMGGLSNAVSLDDRLVNEITAGYGGADLRMHHGTDERGNQVMYIQESR